MPSLSDLRVCPNCNGPLILPDGGTAHCPDCGWNVMSTHCQRCGMPLTLSESGPVCLSCIEFFTEHERHICEMCGEPGYSPVCPRCAEMVRDFAQHPQIDTEMMNAFQQGGIVESVSAPFYMTGLVMVAEAVSAVGNQVEVRMWPSELQPAWHHEDARRRYRGLSHLIRQPIDESAYNTLLQAVNQPHEPLRAGPDGELPDS